LNYRNANYDKSNTNLFEAIQFAKQVENSDTLMAKAYSIIGKNFTLENKFDSAFYYFHKAVKIYDTHQKRKPKKCSKRLYGKCLLLQG
jgi:Tfp pilus assembly protein PilF